MHGGLDHALIVLSFSAFLLGAGQNYSLRLLLALDISYIILPVQSFDLEISNLVANCINDCRLTCLLSTYNNFKLKIGSCS